MAEPLSVALHAVRRAGPLLGKRVLSRLRRSARWWLLRAARRCDRDRRHDVMPTRCARSAGRADVPQHGEQPDALDRYGADKVVRRALRGSGNEHALVALQRAAPRGSSFSSGWRRDEAAINTIVAKEFDLRCVPLPRRVRRRVECSTRAVDVKPLSRPPCPTAIRRARSHWPGPHSGHEGLDELRLVLLCYQIKALCHFFEQEVSLDERATGV